MLKQETAATRQGSPEEVPMDRGALAHLGVAHLVDDMSQGALPAMLPFFIAAHNLSYSAGAGLMLAATIGSSVLQPLLGQFSDRRSAPWLVPVGVFLAGSGVALASLMPTYWLIVVALVLGGVGVAAFHPEAARYANYAAGTRRATGMSFFSLGGSLGFAVGPLIATALMLTFGLPGGALIVLPGAAMALVLFRRMPQFPSPRRTGPGKSASIRILRSDAWGPFALLTVAVIGRSVLSQGLNTFMPLYWRDVLQQPVAIGSLALTILSTSGAAGTLLGGWLADRYGRRRVVLAATAVLTVLLGIFVAAQNAVLAGLLLVPVGVVLFTPMSVLVVMAQEYLPNRLGTAAGVTQGLAFSLGGVAAPLLGAVADLHGVHAVMMVITVLPLFIFAFMAMLPEDQHVTVYASGSGGPSPTSRS